MFVGVKAAFDNVDREKLWKIMEEKSKLTNGIKNIFKDTKITISTKKGYTKRLKKTFHYV